MSDLSPAVEKAFALIETAVIAGSRAPKRPHLDTHTVIKLYRKGLVRGEIYDKNFRVFTMLIGPHAGKSTAPPPNKAKLWLVVDSQGRRRIA